MRLCSTLAALTLLASPAAAQTPVAEQRDWPAVTAADARAFHDALQGSHPGPLDTANPGFQAQLDGGLERALERSRSVRDYAGYVWAMREYGATFNDGHVAVVLPNGQTMPARWPGFMTRYADGQYFVSSRTEARGIPPLGARLVSCDGVSANDLALARVASIRGSWALEATRASMGWRLLVDQGERFEPLPRRCRFESEGRTRTYTLNWAPIAEADLARYRTQSQQRFDGGFAVRRFGAEHNWWVSMANFDSTGGSDNARQLAEIVRQLEAAGPELRNARLVVLDVRGNTGGSSTWSQMIANAIWGEDQVNPRDPPGGYVEWRVSDANIAHIAGLLERWAGDPNAPAASVDWGRRVHAGLTGARDAGQALWQQGESRPMPAPLPPPTGPRVIIVADYVCASACLDALDIWRAMGATQVGVVTGADTVYMEVRREELPSGLTSAVIPMKVYRERPRGHNEPYQPHVRYDGDMSDTVALEAWISALP
jgi:hypothetical protein